MWSNKGGQLLNWSNAANVRREPLPSIAAIRFIPLVLRLFSTATTALAARVTWSIPVVPGICRVFEVAESLPVHG